MTHELNETHQAVADTATAKIVALIARSKLVVAEVIVEDTQD